MKKYKLPRKLKKAAMHIEQQITQFPAATKPDGSTIAISSFDIVTTNGYPYTKWVRKAIRIIKRNRIRLLTQLIQQEVESHTTHKK